MMHQLAAADLLNAWDIGSTLHPIRRALLLLAMAWPETPPDDFAVMSIGRRDAYLLTLRSQLFGAQLNSVAHCPQCGEQLELNFTVDDVRAPMLSDTQPEAEITVRVDDYSVRCRPPNSNDLLAISDEVASEDAAERLLARCLITVAHVDEDKQSHALPATVAEQVQAAIAQRDPQGDVQLALSCPQCSHNWQIAFDILTYLWREIDSWAQRTIQEVHLLASAYGWREADILTLSAQRRQLYLELVMG